MELISNFFLVEDVIFFCFIAIITYFIPLILFRNDLGPFKIFRNVFTFVGVVVHELAHFVITLLVGIVPTEFVVHYFDRMGRGNPHGHILYNPKKPLTFLQNVLIGLAPLYISSWLIYECLLLLFSSTLTPFWFFMVLFFTSSLIMGACPSKQDVRWFFYFFKENGWYSLYQVILVFFAFIFTLQLQPVYPSSIVGTMRVYLNYALIFLFYYILKYGLKGTHRFSRYLYRKRIRTFSNGKWRYRIRSQEPVDSMPEQWHKTPRQWDSIDSERRKNLDQEDNDQNPQEFNEKNLDEEELDYWWEVKFE